MIRSFEFRVYPTEDQEVLLIKHFNATRWVYNWALNIRNIAFDHCKKSVKFKDLQAKLPTMKKRKSRSWLKEINSQTLQSSLKHLEKSYKNFFEKRSGYPNFKKKGFKDSFEIPQNVEVDFCKKIIHLPKFKTPLKVVFHKRFEGEIKTCTIKRSFSGKYFISVLVKDNTILPPKLNPAKLVGADLGLKTFLVASNGTKIQNPKIFRSFEKQLKRAQRKFSRRKKGSRNRQKQKIKVACLHEKIKISRKFFLHSAVQTLFRESQADTICLESLNIKGMLRNHNLAKSISDASWGEFLRILKYKCDWMGVNLIQTDTFFPSSKKCSVCGQKNNDLQLSDRTWVCGACGTTHDRDENAAANILDEGKRLLGLKVGWSPPEPVLPEGVDLTPVEMRDTESLKQESLSHEVTLE